MNAFSAEQSEPTNRSVGLRSNLRREIFNTQSVQVSLAFEYEAKTNGKNQSK
jgi:hypothetical protein